ncbi:hypothetical protein AK812_SmicGene1171 [Symbiodinium microadriaticum]|uniref:Uncharacterized protein n=1 Tax=Symbiodinium microadriaticum TaxID=2951 RepID=A0A1Q9F4T2_SYMMI|nr:hypothetical protein AK812_SmicGene1171 [Symbiodinium microadriaticum]CAE7619045.1 unnamed protein product [Symbiodinium microadriaticum]CAE7943041.1 unnamed protein product [Symbiodinium sp. KB8]
MVLTNVNVVLSTELAREGLLDMSDDFWMKCQEIVYPEGIPQVRPDEDRLWTMLQNYRLKGVIHFLVQIEKRSAFILGGSFVGAPKLSWPCFTWCVIAGLCCPAGVPSPILPGLAYDSTLRVPLPLV